MSQKMNVLFVISEAEPLIKVGGLGDVGGTLPLALKNLPESMTDPYVIDMKVVIPYHDQIKRNQWPVEPVVSFKVLSRNGFITANVFRALKTDLPIYLIDGEPIQNTGTYSSDTSIDTKKYAFFSIAALEFCRAIKWKPDLLHAHDWHTAVAIQKLSQIRSYDTFFSQTKSLYTIHNLPYSGGNHPEILYAFDIHQAFDPEIPQYMRNLPMALGLDAADHINTVSKTYAEEIMTDGFGNGYQNYLRSHSGKVSGIINGIMMEQWNPSAEKVLYKNYSVDTLSDRIENKRMLQQELWLPIKDQTVLFVMVGRMTYQKGFDLCVQALRQMRDLDWQIIILGTGEDSIQKTCLSLSNEFPDRVRTELRYDEPLSRRLYAGGDILLMPSRYEPCGIAQMISMLYGCIPVACATGGLKDTIKDPFDYPNEYTGFLFSHPDVSAAEWAMRRSIEYFQDQDNWRQIQVRAMKQDFSWEKSAKKYFDLYKSIQSSK